MRLQITGMTYRCKKCGYVTKDITFDSLGKTEERILCEKCGEPIIVYKETK